MGALPTLASARDFSSVLPLHTPLAAEAAAVGPHAQHKFMVAVLGAAAVTAVVVASDSARSWLQVIPPSVLFVAVPVALTPFRGAHSFRQR